MGIENGLKSYHIFLFPFQWDYKEENKKGIDLESIEKSLGNKWEAVDFKTDSPDRYNEFTYFHPFAREALFDFNRGHRNILSTYRLRQPEKIRYRIDVNGKQESYDLKIDKILLNMYSTGVGILSYHLENHAYPDFADILMINDYGRRIFPQFLDENKPFTAGPKKAFLADKIKIVVKKNDDEEYIEVEEDFSYYNNIDNIASNPVKLANTVMNILGDRFIINDNKAENGDIVITPVLDDRMFVMCWAAQPDLCRRLKEFNKDNTEYAYLDDGKNEDWYKYMFIDGKECTCRSIPMKKKILTVHTYDRWIEYGTLFGITRYSFVILAESDFVLPHFQNHYYRMVNLVLIQRASMLRFSAETTRIAGLEKPGETALQVQHLHQKYLEFVNKIYFREITAQEQGIELYSHMRQAMNIERDVKDLNTEIDELHQAAAVENDRRKSKLLNMLSYIGALFVVPAFFTSFFGMNIISEKLGITNTPGFISVIVGIVLAALLGLISLGLRNKSMGTKLRGIEKLILILIALIMVALLSMPWWIGIFKGVGP